MRRAHYGAAIVAILTAGGLAAACGPSSDCEEIGTCPPGGPGGGGGGGTPAACVPSENAGAVEDGCGVFVSSSLGDDGNEGTKERPLKTLGAAVAKGGADGGAVYACAETFAEMVVLETAVDVFGGLDCAEGWVWGGGTVKTTLSAGAGEIPLTLAASASGARIEDFAIVAADAVVEGGSSIAVVADGTSAAFVRCDVTAGNGAAGEKGESPTDPVGPTMPDDVGIRGNDGAAACTDPMKVDGGLSKENEICPSGGGGPLGGAGGDGTVLSGGSGEAQPANAQTALGGTGEPAADPTWSCVVGQGGVGANGTPGEPGAGASDDQTLGAVSVSGYTGVSGQPGMPGGPGQGGGGGGGAKGKTGCAGASGGGGGVGGCGGKGGLGGQAGGATIGIISLSATLSFEAVTIRTGQGGAGGDGGDGQGGGIGGNGGNGGNGDTNAPTTLKACNGGAGGQGGTGGKGGGGRGGHAIGIAHTGEAPPLEGVSIETGTPGSGGVGDGPSSDGVAGVKAEVQPF